MICGLRLISASDCGRGRSHRELAMNLAKMPVVHLIILRCFVESFIKQHAVGDLVNRKQTPSWQISTSALPSDLITAQ